MKRVLILIIFLTSILGCKKEDKVITSIKDVEGNEYGVVYIGNQIWMAENLRTTKYRNGQEIVYPGSNSFQWQSLATGAYAWQLNDTSHRLTYGALYNWFAVNTAMLCPNGWRAPNETDWNELVLYLGGEDVAGRKLKATGTLHWNNPNIGTNNETGFNALPGGYRGITAAFYDMGEYGYWWSSTEESESNAWFVYLSRNSEAIGKTNLSKQLGFSVRCIKE